jgi:FAD/FMN-containing dehydrogenase
VTSSGPDWAALAVQLAGEVLVPGSPGYDAVRTPAMARFHDVWPTAIVRCGSPADVSAAIDFARRAGLPTAVRCGGHSVAGRSVTDGVIIDVTPMDQVIVTGGIATVGAGARLGNLYAALFEHGVTIPAGCGPSVGIAGLTLGGGIGILGRTYGLTCDRLRGAEVVMADGRVIACDQEHHADLFWALRGAGAGNFGVVTSLVFDTVPAPDTTVFQLVWPFGHAAALTATWQAWAPVAPVDVDATLRLAVGSDPGHAQVELIGAVLGSESDAAQRLDAFVSRAPASPASAWYDQLTYPAAKRQLDAIDQHRQFSSPGEAPGRGHLYAKSEFFRQPLEEQAILAVAHSFAQDMPGARAREVAFMPWGGAYNAVAPDATAFPHRSELFLVQHLLEVDPQATETDREASRSWLSRSWAVLHPSGSGGVYPNFPDPDLQDWGRAYYGDNYPRLQHVKATYDPDNAFRFHQSVPLPGS